VRDEIQRVKAPLSLEDSSLRNKKIKTQYYKVENVLHR
jgi:hypothetical protein